MMTFLSANLQVELCHNGRNSAIIIAIFVFYKLVNFYTTIYQFVEKLARMLRNTRTEVNHDYRPEEVGIVTNKTNHKNKENES